jgi:hypothetical protein
VQGEGIPAEIEPILHNYATLFEGSTSLPPSREVDHTIPLLSQSKLVNSRPYRYSHYQKLELEKIIEELLKSSAIRPSCSLFASPALLVKKKDRTWRLCVNYRQ